MTAAGWSLLALLAAIALSVVTRLNVGVVAIAMAWLVGVFAAGLGAGEVVAGFPANLFLTLAGVTLLFSAAESNGTLERLTRRAMAGLGSDGRRLPILFFAVAGLISSLGPGSIAAVALVAPLAMSAALRTGFPPFLMALMVANGANAGNLSPVSAVGVIANTTMAGIGLGGHEAMVWFANFAAHVVVTAVAWLAMGGHRPRPPVEVTTSGTAFERRHLVTLTVVLTWIAGVLLAGFPLGLSAFLAAAVLFAARQAEESAAIRGMPWGVMVMVSGVSLLIAVLEKSGGMELFTGLLARLATAGTVNGVIAFVTGAISSYSSTSGVVLPAFLPTAASLAERVGGDPLAVALSINVGASIVDVSPLSTLGALCLAAVPDGPGATRLFRQLLVWGLAMTVVGALLSLLFAGPAAALAGR